MVGISVSDCFRLAKEQVEVAFGSLATRDKKLDIATSHLSVQTNERSEFGTVGVGSYDMRPKELILTIKSFKNTPYTFNEVYGAVFNGSWKVRNKSYNFACLL